MIELRNDFGRCRRWSRTGCATPRRGAFQLLYGTAAGGAGAPVRRGSHLQDWVCLWKNQCGILTIQSAWRWCFDTHLCCCDLSVAQEHPRSNPIHEPTSGLTEVLTGILCMSSGLSPLQKLSLMQRGTCLWAHDKSIPTVLCGVIGLRRQRPPVW